MLSRKDFFFDTFEVFFVPVDNNFCENSVVEDLEEARHSALYFFIDDVVDVEAEVLAS